jgi:hypothetical protein
LIDEGLKNILVEEMAKLDKLTVTASLTIEALEPVFETDNGRGGVLSCMDLCYNAFMIGRNMENRESGGRCDWFNDTLPLMTAGVERLKKETVERMQYAADDRRRTVSRNTEKTDCTLSADEIDAGAACLYGQLDQSFTGGDRVSYPQASSHTKGKYQRAFASAVVASERGKVTA